MTRRAGSTIAVEGLLREQLKPAGDRFVQPNAQSRQGQGGIVASVQWDWFITPESFLETKAFDAREDSCADLIPDEVELRFDR